METHEVAGDVMAAAAAFGGLILVFLGAAAAKFESFDRNVSDKTRWKYRLRAWLAYSGLALSCASAGTALGAKMAASDCATWVAIVFLGIAAAIVLIAAFFVTLEVG
jgi:putative Mn2+ efflux pump MntP